MSTQPVQPVSGNSCSGNILVAILELPIIKSEATSFCDSFLSSSRRSQRDEQTVPVIKTEHTRSTSSGHVITDLLARDIEEIRDLEQRQPSKTVNPLPAWVAGYAASQISAACECVEGSERIAKKLKAAPVKRGSDDVVVIVESTPTPSMENTSQGGRGNRRRKARRPIVEEIQVELA